MLEEPLSELVLLGAGVSLTAVDKQFFVCVKA